MAVLGKKRKASEPAPSAEEAEEIFRRHFESRFKPLDVPEAAATQTTQDQGEDDSGEEEEEWGGLSDEEAAGDDTEQPAVEVVDHSSSQTSKPTTMSKRELKAFMSSRPPDSSILAKGPGTTARETATSSSTALPEDAPSLLAQDLELRRLLSESHLLSALNGPSSLPSATGELKAFATGRTRQKATDMRIQALGSKMSIHKQEKMPMNIRKGIAAVATARETKRRREAKENGVILEREAPKKSKRERRKDFGVDRPGVGRLSGASLRLSDRDIKSIEGTRDTFGRRGRR